jgi:acetylornithine deacetylase/succinyl-diaminopimelate desuccinylase-like protein
MEMHEINTKNMDQTLARLMEIVEEATDELVELHQSLVRVPTVNTGAPDSGHEIEVCRLLEARFEREGIASSTLESAPTRGNLLAHTGNQARPRLLLMSHTDVVPADESRWKRAPFCADIVDGEIYGRGSQDAKSIVASGAMSLILLKRAGIPLRGELRFLAAADEEAGGRYGIAWLAMNHPDEIRSDWAINEGGGMPLKAPQGLVFLISTGEKGRMEARFEISGRSSHAAYPWRADNALYKLSRLLRRLEEYQPEVDVSLPLFTPLRLMGIHEKPTPENLDALLLQLAKKDPVQASTLKALSRMTIAPSIVAAGLKSNSIPASAHLTCDIRTLPHQDERYVRRELNKIINGIEGVSLELEVTAISNASPDDSPFLDRLRMATATALGQDEVELLPSLTGGFTDSRYVRPLGSQVYGFEPTDPDLDFTSRAHAVDEAFAIRNLVLQTKMQVALAYLTLG